MSSTPPLAAPATPAPEAPSLPLPPRGPIGRRTRAFAVLAVLGAFAGSYLGLRLADRQAAPAARASGALQGAVFAVSRGAADKAGGFTITPPGGTAQTAGPKAQVGPGSVLKTDARTRARVKLADGTDLVLDRGSELVLEAQARTARLVEGSALIEAASVAGAPPLTVRTALGDARVLGTKLVVTTSADRTNVEVLRGEVEVQGAGQGDGTAKVLAGQEAVLTKAARPEVVPATDLARRTAFGEALVAHNEDTEGDTGGLGELRAKRPGKTDEKDRVVRLARHDVKVRIAGAVARTEIEEVFTNESDDELEGLYRFPLPPGAQMERLALDVDGKLVEGEFVDAARAQAIWRGVIQHAAPSAPKPREEWVWVPGPWRDPALLEWKRGGRFELKIFPIPKRGSRRVVLAYTEAIAPSAGLRRYTYPLPHTTSSDMVIEQFHVDARVLGSDKPASVQPRGYELTRSEQGGAVALSTEARSFRPSGDLVIEYSLGDQRSPLSAHAFATPAAGGKPGERFAAIALRPQLPKWTDVRPRDQVIVVDSGRSMFGERFRRARRLAVEMAQEMDRRDRVTVMTCDMRCRPLAAGLIGPGSTASHDVDAFLSGVTPDGASDLVGAVREASRVAGRDGSRDLRVTLLSGGHATAGHRATDRVADEVRDAVGDLAHTSVLAVPIGGDSDVTFLSEVARGGGGVVLPYQPGERLATAALDVLNASYGTVLRDATLTLPEGLVDAAPGVLPPLRGGGETLVGVRMLRDRVEGEIVLRGTVGGEPFEQRTPVTLTATDAPGNAFVPRVFAANRIADREREAGDAGKTELIELSKRFLVPSRFTSLLVLESEAMFQAFGIQRGGNTQVRWTGDDLATGLIAGTKSAETEKDDSHDLGGAMELKVPAGAGGFGALAGPSPTSPAPAPPADAPAAKPKAEAFGGASRADEAPRKGAPWQPSMPPPPRGRGEWMKRVWRRTAAVTEGRGAVVPGDKLSAARSALAAAPDERNKHRDLARLLAVQGELSELDDVLTKWNERDPLDADAIAWRADLSARRGDRAGALRVLTGALASTTASPREASLVALAAAEAYERAHDPAACALRITVSELRPGDVEAAARAVRCEEGLGHARSAMRLRKGFQGAKLAALEAALARIGSEKADTARGDIVISANWEGADDLDLALLDPTGVRASFVSRLPGVHVVDPTGLGREELGVSNAKPGAFLVEVTRATRGAGRPISGTVKISSGGSVKQMPFVLTGDSVVVGRVDARYEETLVSESGDRSVPPTPWGIGGRPFDRASASAALSRVNLQSCARPNGPTGVGHVTVVFSPAGFVSSAVVDGGPFPVTAIGACISARFRGIRVAPFDGVPVSIGKTFTLRSAPWEE
ncbi:MAG: FecR domain-containing protein [Myxococcales bacterium]|nr:FecR domain-containing protein [Myxococcales bacterium]